MKRLAAILIFFFVLAGIWFSLSCGSSFFSLSTILSALRDSASFPYESTVLRHIRIPRLLAGFFVGAGLSLSGVVLQAILKNPLAESYTLGISGGACLGVAAGLFFASSLWVPFFAFIGGTAAVFFVLSLGGSNRFSPAMLLLLGVMMNFIFSSLSLLVVSSFHNAKFLQTVVWLMGDLNSSPELLVRIMPFVLIPCAMAIWLFHRDFDLFSLGEEKARSLGLATRRKRIIWILLVSLITSFSVSIAGIIGFVGLVIPHAARFISGAEHRHTIPAAFFIGGAFLVITDTLARVLIRPYEIPVGVMSGFFGGILFLLMLIRETRRRVW